MITTDIWGKGFEIEREGQKITLTTEEIRDIYNSISASNGKGSIEYYQDTYLDMNEDEMGDEEKVEYKALKEMKKDARICYEIWEEFYDAILCDSGDIECDCVRMAIENYSRKGDN